MLQNTKVYIINYIASSERSSLNNILLFLQAAINKSFWFVQQSIYACQTTKWTQATDTPTLTLHDWDFLPVKTEIFFCGYNMQIKTTDFDWISTSRHATNLYPSTICLLLSKRLFWAVKLYFDISSSQNIIMMHHHQTTRTISANKYLTPTSNHQIIHK